MKKYLKTALILCAICGAAALLLAVVNSLTAPKIAAYEEEQKQAVLGAVSNGEAIGDFHSVSGVSNITGYYGLGKSSFIVMLSTTGYGGEITLAAAYDTNGKLTAAKVLSDSETPGLGKKSEESWYMDKFLGKSSDMPTKKTELSTEDAQAISGASVTFTGISKALLSGSSYVTSVLKGGKN